MNDEYYPRQCDLLTLLFSCDVTVESQVMYSTDRGERVSIKTRTIIGIKGPFGIEIAIVW